MDRNRLLEVGRISGVYGVRGWVRIYSHMTPRDEILGYTDWYLRRGDEPWRSIRMLEGRQQGKGIVARLEGVNDRDTAHALIATDIAIDRDALPPPEPGTYYWADLEGAQVVTIDGVALGTLDHLFETGANDVMVVRGEDRERLIPFVVDQVVKEVDLGTRVVRVDWDPDF